jgi:hypothetical protein
MDVGCSSLCLVTIYAPISDLRFGVGFSVLFGLLISFSRTHKSMADYLVRDWVSELQHCMCAELLNLEVKDE